MVKVLLSPTVIIDKSAFITCGDHLIKVPYHLWLAFDKSDYNTPMVVI